MKDYFIEDFQNSLFQLAFKAYFEEMDVIVKDWEGLFCEMNEDKETYAYLRVNEKGNVIGFLCLRMMK